MSWIQEIAPLLNMDITKTDDGEEYLTTPVAGGAVEVHSDKSIWYLEWHPNGAVIKEDKLGTLVDNDLKVQAMLMRIITNRAENDYRRF